MTTPSMDPHLLLTLVRTCVPDQGPICEAELRSLLSEVDAHIAEFQAAADRCLPQTEAA